ncbi:hypothetical protein [Ottowia sp.]|jgi:hypothetical protein|uniref:hypothetical protein n=1 Tax=Ottowia sp. TaxID=1898956 RepID=UPI0025E31549|nr:hypothetical protein [Ottowia sp.]MBK6614164.1 hypothetical protein [Ottowia sp.]
MARIAKALAIWLVILICAVANGALREGLLILQLGKSPGLILSGVLLSALILVITFLALPWLGARRQAQLIGIGAFWLALTLVFELSFGRFQGKSWATILEAYTFKDGNIWPVVLLVTAVAPYVAARLRSLP